MVQLLHYIHKMVTLHNAVAWKIAIYGNEHGIPHFHIEGPGFRCSIGIESLKVIVGGAPPKILHPALEWAAANRDLLRRTWKEWNP